MSISSTASHAQGQARLHDAVFGWVQRAGAGRYVMGAMCLLATLYWAGWICALVWVFGFLLTEVSRV